MWCNKFTLKKKKRKKGQIIKWIKEKYIKIIIIYNINNNSNISEWVDNIMIIELLPCIERIYHQKMMYCSTLPHTHYRYKTHSVCWLWACGESIVITGWSISLACSYLVLILVLMGVIPQTKHDIFRLISYVLVDEDECE